MNRIVRIVRIAELLYWLMKSLGRRTSRAPKVLYQPDYENDILDIFVAISSHKRGH